jgi:peptidoglycan/xylan/chitin deacetylase (PgdA/CDA1 family)
MPKLIASLSLDLDNKWSYLKTRGDPRWEALPSYFDVVVPRALSTFEALGVRATVFVVGLDAAQPANQSALQSLAAAGHEIGNHSMQHEPWLHRYTPEALEADIRQAQFYIETATGCRPVGFRGPGFSFSPELLRLLARSGFRYDASTFPTFLGPLARAYYFFTAGLSRGERKKREALFGKLSEGFRPVRPYWWNLAGEQPVASKPTPPVAAEERLLEIPVTTMPWLKLPIHVSYLLYLASYSRRLARAYFAMAMTLCRASGVGPSLLLHPLDFLGCDDDVDLAFFPAMNLPAAQKIDFVTAVLESYGRRFEVVSMMEHARCIAGRSADDAVQPGPLAMAAAESSTES